MGRLFVVALVSGGCTLLFDPSGVKAPARDAAEPSLDLHAQSVDDLSVAPSVDMAVLEDMTPPAEDMTPPRDLAPPQDLLHPDLLPCVPPVFVGFYDMGSADPLDCNACGCVIDPLTNSESMALKFANAKNPTSNSTITDTTSDAGLTFSATNGDEKNSDYDLFSSQNRFYLDGDFDLEMDYQASGLPWNGFLQLYAVGPPADGGFATVAPYSWAQTYQANNLWHFNFYTDDRSEDVDTLVKSGTLRIRRTSGKLCASVVGRVELCDSATSPQRVWIQIEAVVSNGACDNGAKGPCVVPYNARVYNLRLKHGSLASRVQ